ncbi:MAG: BNR-4 repeat-containing protein [Verrucomicrobiota bacterium]
MNPPAQFIFRKILLTRLLLLLTLSLAVKILSIKAYADDPVTLNLKADGYSGIWYMNQPSNDEYVYKYSGGMGTYCAKHKPFAIYSKEADKTFFCYGGTTKGDKPQLLHMVSFFDHKTKSVPRPTILLNKQTDDAHDNPVISIDDQGFIWIFSTSHGTSRPSYIHRSKKPYDIDEFELVPATYLDSKKRAPITNFSYMQAWHRPGKGFLCFFTRYKDPAARTIGAMVSKDGVTWGSWQRLAAIGTGHYQVSALGGQRAGSAFNYHPKGKGLNWRTNLYYVETPDFGNTWQTASGTPLSLPLRQVANPALVHDYASEGLNVYMKDIRFDEQDRPVILYITSKGYEAGPKNDPRTWTTARWDGEQWLIRPVTASDNNYDSGSLWLVAKNDWRIIGPTQTGPQPYNPGGEVAMWTSHDQGETWKKTRQLTSDSPMNHTYVRQPLDAHPDFFAFWADGHGRKPSPSRLYFSDRDGKVYQLPETMKSDYAKPIPIGADH